MYGELSFSEFVKRYPTDVVCLEEIRKQRFPSGIKCHSCRRTTKHYRVKSRPAFSCTICRTHTYPLAGTLFAKSTTPLRLWFYALFLITHTQGEIGAKQLQRELGVTYKTAWRMKKLLIKLLHQRKERLFFSSREDDKTSKTRRWVFFKHFEIAIVEKEQSDTSS